MTDTVYSSGYEDWVAYSDPIPAEPVTVESTPAPTPLTEPAPPTNFQSLLLRPTPETTPETTPEQLWASQLL
jgi:hypothetical protein